MALGQHLQHDHDRAGFDLLYPARFERFPRIDQALEFAAVYSQFDIGGAFVARYELERHAHGGAHDFRDVIGGGARADAAEFQRCFGRQAN